VNITVIGTLDTKGEEAVYAKGLIESRGHFAAIIDVGPLIFPLSWTGHL